MTTRSVSIAEIASTEPRSISIGPFGSDLRADLYTLFGVRVVRGQDISDGRILDTSRMPCVSEDAAEKLRAYVATQDDLIFPHRGAIGRVGIVGEEPVILSSSLMRLRVDKSLVDPMWLMYYFRGPGRAELLNRASTVGTPGIGQPLKSLREIIIRLPSLSIQTAIAAVLGALDDKVAANTAVAETADTLSEARFAALEKPTFTPLTDVARFINGKAFTKDASGSGRVVIRIAELNSGIGNSTAYSDIDVADDHVARPGDLLFAWSGSLTVHRWYRPEAIINQHIFKVMPRDRYPMWLAHRALRSRLSDFKSIASDKATTMGHIQRRHLEERVALPSPNTIARETELMDGLWRVALSAERENLTLTELRDTLLPALMSGRLRVKDAERQVEDAV